MLERSKKLDVILKYLTAVIIIIIPLYPKFPLISIPGTYVSIRLEDFVLICAAIVLVKVIILNFRTFLAEKTVRAIILYLAVGFVSLLSGILITKTVLPHLGLLHWLRRIEYFIPFFIGFYALISKRNLEFYLKIIMLTIFIAFLYGLGQRYFNLPIIVTQNLEYSSGVALRYISGSHINSTFAGHYDLGTYLVLLLPVFISMFFLIKNKSTKFIVLIVVSGGLWLLSYSGSRISVFSYLVAVSITLILIRKYKEIVFVIIFSLLFFSMSQNLTARYLRIFEVAGRKLIGTIETHIHPVRMISADEVNISVPKRTDLPSPTPTPQPVFEDRSTSIRIQVEWPRALRAFLKNPIFGTGYSSITLATDNDYLRLLGELGILGFMAFILIFLKLGRLVLSKFPLMKNYKGIELAFVTGVIGGSIGIFINASLLDVFEASKFAITFWLITGMLVYMMISDNYE
jgi:hypothetical protein